MFDPEFQRKALSLVMGFIMEFSGTLAELEPVELTADNLNVSTISVSCLKVTWDSEPDRDYYVSCMYLFLRHWSRLCRCSILWKY